MDFLCQSSDESHCKPECSQLDVGDVVSNLFESNATGVTNFSFEGHCAMTNADEANENVVTAKKGKKRGIRAITSFQVACVAGGLGRAGSKVLAAKPREEWGGSG